MGTFENKKTTKMNKQVADGEPGNDNSQKGLPEVWLEVVAGLATRLSADDFQRYISVMRFVVEDRGQVILAVPTRFILDRVTGDLQGVVQRVWLAKDPRNREIRLISWADDGHQYADLLTDPWAETAAAEMSVSAAPAGEPVSRDRQHQTFSTLVVGPSNERAFQLMRHLADGGDVPARTLLLFGPQGTGKTHLMTALQQAVEAAGDGRRVVYMTAEEFRTLYVSGAIERDTRALKNRVRSGDLLLIDDLHWIADSPGTDLEFFASLRAVMAHGGLIIMTADAAPGELKGFSPRLRSELKGGASVEVGLPDAEMRRKIVEMHAGLQREKAPAFVVTGEMIDRICQRVRGSGRELTGVLWTLYTEAGIGTQAPTLEMLEIALRRHEGDLLPPTIDMIKRATSAVFPVSRNDLEGKCKAQAVTYPRQIAMYLARDMTSKSYPQIGNAFGGRDHATVIHAVRKITRMLTAEGECARHVEAVRAEVYALQS